MCGFAGEFFLRAGRADLAVAKAMAARLRHRGPDEESSYLSPDGRCAIGFQRLAIIDPLASHQPMTSADERVTIAFNGEIYNFLDLRRELAADGAVFRTAGDTEVLLHLYQRHGQGMLDYLEGMFAFAIYDASAGRLLLARDRLGQRPLWYAALPDRIVFASEAKALLAHPQVPRQVDLSALTYYLSVGYIPAPLSAWRGLRKLAPGSFLAVGATIAEPQRYWAPAPASPPPTHAEAIEQVRGLVTASVRQHMVSDVPIGALLSGGVDSSIIVALMAQAAGAGGGIRTFTAGFSQQQYDERPAARAVAEHCGTNHTELFVDPAAELPHAVDRIVDIYDEPFADSSALPTWLICQAAARHVKVALVGDGGDEAFCGYDRYRAMRLAETMGPGMYAVARLAMVILRPFAPHDERNRLRRFIRFAESLPQPPPWQYLALRSIFTRGDLPRLLTDNVITACDMEAPSRWFCDLFEHGEFDDEATRAQHQDLLTYLPDDLLVKTDMASMASSLELRVPMLDRRVVAAGLSLPARWKLGRQSGKQILRDAFGGLLPAETFSRPKRGFGVPMADWLRGGLRGTLQETLLDPGLARQQILRPEALVGLVNDHLAGRDDHGHRLWALLVLARWLARQG